MNGLQSHEWRFVWINFIHHVVMFDVNVYDTHPPYFNSSKITSHFSSSTLYIKEKNFPKYKLTMMFLFPYQIKANIFLQS
jgi:hypothetical protein